MSHPPNGLIDTSEVNRETCPHCSLAILPGETHGEIVNAISVPILGISGDPRIVCRVRKLQMVEEVIEASGGGQR